MKEGEQVMDQLAAGMLQIAQQRLLGVYPFHARFVARWHVQASSAVRTMGVTVRSGAIVLLFNPDFVVGCSYAELIGVLLHEVNHLLFDHLFFDPTGFPDCQTLVVAEEVTANEWIHEPLPGNPILLSDYPQLPPNEDTCTRYQRLAQEVSGAEFSPGLPQNWGPADPKISPMESNLVPSAPKSVRHGPLSDPLETLDDHTLWAAALRADPLARLAVHALIREVAENLPAEQLRRMPATIQERIAAICRGDTPGTGMESLRKTGRGHLDWRRVLRRYVREATEVRPVFTRPPRRFPELVGIVPGQLHRPMRVTVMAVIDTSGSMSGTILALIADELERMACRHTVTVVECDATVHAVYPYSGGLREVRGCGGTDLRPPFDPGLLSRVRPDVIIYFTDGGGPAPQSSPALPVIWCLTPDGQKPASWGREIRLSHL